MWFPVFYIYSNRKMRLHLLFIHDVILYCFLHPAQCINNSKQTYLLSNPLRLHAMMLDSRGKTGGHFSFTSHKPRMIPPSTHPVSLALSFSPTFIFFLCLPLANACPSTLQPGDIKGVESKTKTSTHPYRAVLCLHSDVHRAKVQNLIPSELMQVFVDSQGLEVFISVVFIMNRQPSNFIKTLQGLITFTCKYLQMQIIFFNAWNCAICLILFQCFPYSHYPYIMLIK